MSYQFKLTQYNYLLFLINCLIILSLIFRFLITSHLIYNVRNQQIPTNQHRFRIKFYYLFAPLVLLLKFN